MCKIIVLIGLTEISFKKFQLLTAANLITRKILGEFKYIDIKDLVNNIKNNTISEISSEKDLNTLNEIKNAGMIKPKKRTPKQKELLNLFNNLSGTILTDKTIKSESQKDNILMSSKDENVNENENVNDKAIISSKDNDDENENESEDDDEIMDQNKKSKIMKETNDLLDEIIDKSKSFEEQIKSLKNEKI